jgi:ATP-dependent DNA helicase 2 subunit 1
LSFCYQILLQKFYFQLGVVLYNTEHSPQPEGNLQMEIDLVVPKKCAILVPLKPVEADVIRYVKNLKASEDLMDFDNRFGHSTDAKIADVLWLCLSMFTNCGKKIRESQIMWFTDQDEPHKVNSADHQQAFQKAKDLQQLQIVVQFYPMKMDFDGDLFYKELLVQILGESMDEFEFPKPQLNEKIIQQRMFRRDCTRRAISNLVVEISPQAKFGVGIYSFTRKSEVPRPVVLDSKTHDHIEAKRSYKYGNVMEVDDADEEDDSENRTVHQTEFNEKLEPSKMIKYQQNGGEKIKFSPLEAYEIKQVMEPKIKVLGFKPKSVLQQDKHIKAPYFVYPSDNLVKNSAVMFRAMWERCLADDKIIICLYTMKQKSYPRLVALVPQRHDEDNTGESICYDGFRLEFIPFANDIRDLSALFVERTETSEEMNAAMKKIITKLRVNYNPTMFENPVVSRIYSAIEAVEFDDDIDEDLEKDTTLPNLEAQDTRIEPFVDQIETLLEDIEDAVVAPKRKAADKPSGDNEKKKLLLENVDADEVIRKCKEGKIKELTVPILHAVLKMHNVTGLSKLSKAKSIEKVLELAK